MKNAKEVVQKIVELQDGKPYKGYWMVHCPCHDDKKPSLEVSFKGNNVRLFCHANCATKDVIKYFRKAGIWPERKVNAKLLHTYIYTDKKGKKLFRVEKYDDNKYYSKHYEGNGKWKWGMKDVKRVLYNLPNTLKAIKDGKVVFFVEGEKDVETLLDYDIPATTNPHGAGSWQKSYNKVFEGGRIIICPDNDNAGKAHALKVADAIYKEAQKIKIVSLDDLDEGGDISDWFEKGGTREELQKIVRQTEEWFPERETASAQERMNAIIRTARDISHLQSEVLVDIAGLVLMHDHKEITDAQFHERIFAAIIGEMIKKGRFYKTKEPRFFWFENEKFKLYDMDTEEFISWFRFQYAGEGNYKNVSDYCRQVGSYVDIYKFVYYDKKKNVLYKFDNANMVFKLDGETREVVPNGTNGILFEVERGAEVIKSKGTKEKFLKGLIFNGTNFDIEDENERKEQLFMFECWFYSLFFPELMQTKPIALWWGEKGSGKTFILQMLLKIFYGEIADVITLTQDEKDFVTKIVNTYFCAIDNADEYIKWLANYLATGATSGIIPIRKLYANSEILHYRLRLFFAITARTPKFRRDDVADRLLIFKVRRFTKFEGAEELTENVMNHRAELWDNIFNKLNFIIKKLGENDGKGLATMFRIADWYKFVRRIIPENQTAFFDKIIDKTIEAQEDYASETEPLLEVLALYMEDLRIRMEVVEEDHTSGEWHTILSNFANEKHLTFYKRANTTGAKFNLFEMALKRIYNIKKKKEGKWVRWIISSKD